MFKVFINAWKVQDIRKKLFYVVLILAIYRIGCHIPMPGIDYAAFQQYMAGQDVNTSVMMLFQVIAGGGIGSILAMGIGPFITSSIIMQLLCVAIPALEKIQKDGEEGRKKINQYTRFVTIILAVIQGAGIVYKFHQLFVYQNIFVYAIGILSLSTGSIFVMWLSELLTERGIGRGSSFVVFSNILAGFPQTIHMMTQEAVGSPVEALKVIIVCLLSLCLFAFVVLIQEGERRIPVQYSKKMVGRQMYGGQSSYIPIKVNIAGVMSIIFAISLLQFPAVIAQFIPSQSFKDFSAMLNITAPLGAFLYVLLIFFFTFFYTSFSINPVEMAENMKKSGGFIPGIRPGKPTSDYITKVINRLSWMGALCYAVIAMCPVLFQWIFNVKVGFGGTTFIILLGVAVELLNQMESQMLVRHYKGFLD